MRFIFTLLGLLFFGSLNAQIIIQGQVTSRETGEPLIGATIQVLSNLSSYDTITDENGNYSFKAETTTTPTFRIFASYVGFDMMRQIVTPETNSEEIIVNFKLSPSLSSILDEIVVTGSQNAKKIENEPVSIEIIKPDFIRNNNVNSLADIMDRVPGTQIVDGQINIRNSGFSIGAGSRVGILVDGQSLLSGLASDIQWNFIPIENASQIEVMKGASSVLYGSAAMNGVINVQTAWPGSKPEMSISYYTVQFDNPRSEYQKWWTDNDDRPFNRGLFASYRQKINKFDLVLGGNFHESVGYLQDLDEERFRFNWKTRYRLTDKINFGINGNIMNHKERRWLIWQDADTNALRHIAPYSFAPFTTISIDPYLKIQDNAGNQHEANFRYYSITVDRRDGFQSSPANVSNAEYRFKRTLSEKHKLTLGLSYQSIYAEDLSYSIDTTQELFTSTADVAAIFGQFDGNFLNDRLNVIAGLRGERVNAGGGEYQAIIPVWRASALYKVSKTGRLRANAGQGYRVPSLLERFAESTLIVTGVPFFPTLDLLPNPSVLPEIGWSVELGYKHLFKGNNLNGYIDLAFFNMNYKNLAELTFGYHGEEGAALDFSQIGFKTINTSPSRIAGFELSSNLNAKLFNIPVRIWGGYTYTYPADLDSINNNNMSYFSNAVQAFSNVDSTLASTMLRYRSLHTARLDVEFNLKPITVGFTSIYNGYMWQIDEVFLGKGTYGELVTQLLGEELIPGFKDFREETQAEGGTWVFDARISADISKNVRLFFIVNNITNKEYSLRPGRMNPMRSFNFKCQLTL